MTQYYPYDTSSNLLMLFFLIIALILIRQLNEKKTIKNDSSAIKNNSSYTNHLTHSKCTEYCTSGGLFESNDWVDDSCNNGCLDDGCWDNGYCDDGCWDDGCWDDDCWEDGCFVDCCDDGCWEDGCFVDCCDDGYWDDDCLDNDSWSGFDILSDVTPFEMGGNDLDQGNSFNLDFF